VVISTWQAPPALDVSFNLPGQFSHLRSCVLLLPKRDARYWPHLVLIIIIRSMIGTWQNDKEASLLHEKRVHNTERCLEASSKI
jgi:hypothetical protein